MRSEGGVWEDSALRKLQVAGLTLIQRNWSCRLGELDLVMRDGDTIVFVEVRYRDESVPGGAMASIGPAKRAKLVKAASLYLAQRPALAQQPCRFDVVAFDAEGDSVRCEWQRHAFDAF